MKFQDSRLYFKVLAVCLTIISTFALGEESGQTDDSVFLTLEIPSRQNDALSGSAFASTIQTMELARREAAILNEVIDGNIPPFLRDLVHVETREMIDDTSYTLVFFVMPDYLSVGSNADNFRIPMTPILAQRIMDEMGGMLPTRKMVDLIWRESVVKLTPQPIPPSPAMVTVDVFREHDALVSVSRSEYVAEHPLGSLVSGHKKDVILSNRIASQPDKVVIYGWHYPHGEAIQPLYSGHVNWYADYSHGIRVILNKALLNDSIVNLTDLLRDPMLYQLLSDESGVMETTRYDTSQSNYPKK